MYLFIFYISYPWYVYVQRASQRWKNNNTLHAVRCEVSWFPTFPWSVNAASGTSLPVEGALSVPYLILSQTYTNMAISQAVRMQSSLRCALYLVVLAFGGINSSTLRSHLEQRFMPPQNRGFFTIEADVLSPDGGGGGAAAPALPLADRSTPKGGSISGTNPQHRSRRSSGESAMPRVYGQVMKGIPVITVHLSRGGLHRLRLVFSPENDFGENDACLCRVVFKCHHYCTLLLLCFTVVWRGKSGPLCLRAAKAVKRGERVSPGVLSGAERRYSSAHRRLKWMVTQTTGSPNTQVELAGVEQPLHHSKNESAASRKPYVVKKNPFFRTLRLFSFIFDSTS